MHEVLRRCPAMAAEAGAPRPLLMSINCMKLSEPRAVYAHILAGLAQAQAAATGGARAAEGDGGDAIVRPLVLGKCREAFPLASLRRALVRSSGGGSGGAGAALLVLVLDEVDQLLSGKHDEVCAAPRLWVLESSYRGWSQGQAWRVVRGIGGPPCRTPREGFRPPPRHTHLESLYPHTLTPKRVTFPALGRFCIASSHLPSSFRAAAEDVARRAQVLYELLALPYMKGSRLLLIGIANSIDLAQRTLSRMPAQVTSPPRAIYPRSTLKPAASTLGSVFLSHILMSCFLRAEAQTPGTRSAPSPEPAHTI